MTVHDRPRMTTNDRPRTTAHDCARPRTTDHARPRTTTHARPRTTTHDRPRTHDHARPRTTDHSCHICLRKRCPPHPRGFRGLNCLARLALARERTPSGLNLYPFWDIQVLGLFTGANSYEGAQSNFIGDEVRV